MKFKTKTKNAVWKTIGQNQLSNRTPVTLFFRKKFAPKITLDFIWQDEDGRVFDTRQITSLFNEIAVELEEQISPIDSLSEM